MAEVPPEDRGRNRRLRLQVRGADGGRVAAMLLRNSLGGLRIRPTRLEICGGIHVRLSSFQSIIVQLVLFLAGCGSAGLNSIAIAPSTQVLNSVGATVQFTAIGTYVQGSHPPSTKDITNQVAWSSSNAAVVTVSSSGLATAVAPGSPNVTNVCNIVVSDNDTVGAIFN